MKKVNIHIIPSNIVNASRLFKETKTIINSGNFDEVILLGKWNNSLFEKENMEDGKRIIYRLKLLKDSFSPKIFFWKILISISIIQYRIKILYFLKKFRPALVNCHQILLLPICVYGKFFFKYKLIYDAHELETEVDGLRGLKKKYLKFTERLFIRYVDEVIVVGEKIAEWYRENYEISNVHVVRNFPYAEPTFQEYSNSLLKKEFHIPDQHLLFIYNGFLTTGRGIELTLDAFSKINGKHSVVFMGYGPLSELVKKYHLRFNNIYYKNAVLPSEVIKYTRGADIGIIIPQNTCLSYYYGMPNKLFEYIQAGIPSIVSNFPEMRMIVQKYQCGWDIEPNTDILQKFIEDVTERDLLEKKKKIKIAQSELCWERESIIYEKLCN